MQNPALFFFGFASSEHMSQLFASWRLKPAIADGSDNPGWHRNLVKCSYSAANDAVAATCLLKPRVNTVSIHSCSCLALHSECLCHRLLCGPDACVLLQKRHGTSLLLLVHCECLLSPSCAMRANVRTRPECPSVSHLCAALLTRFGSG